MSTEKTVTIRLDEREQREIKRARESLQTPWPPSRHRFMKQMMFRGIESFKEAQNKQVEAP
jgi:hypothetical protein